MSRLRWIVFAPGFVAILILVAGHGAVPGPEGPIRRKPSFAPASPTCMPRSNS